MSEKRKNCFKTPFLAIPMLINRKPVQERGISENAVFPHSLLKGLSGYILSRDKANCSY